MHKTSLITPLVCASVLALLMMAWPAGTALAAGDGFQISAGERELFLDDVGIAKIADLQRTMHAPAKKGAVVRPDTSLGVNSVQLRMAPIWSPEKKVWQLWDCASEPDDLHAQGYFVSGYYESPDGLHWSKIPVGEIEYRGSKQNNYVTVVMGGGRHRAECIVYDAADPDPNRRYKTLTPNVFNHGRGGYAVSPDGIHWKEAGGTPIIGGDEWNLTLDEKEHLFLQYLKRGSKHGRAIWLSTSKDFKNWSKPELIFQADDLDQELGVKRIEARLADPAFEGHLPIDPKRYKTDVYHMSPFRYESLYLGTPALYYAIGASANGRNTDGFHVVELVCSRDVKNWTRVGDRKPFIEPSKTASGAYDLTQIIGPASAVIREKELWFYYTGIRYRGLAALPETRRLHPGWGAICLAVMRRDGFVSLDADAKQGTIVTAPFKSPGEKLFVNVDAFAGQLNVEVIDTNGKVLAASAPMKGDLHSGEVKWKTGDLGRLKGKTVSLRFSLKNASLYSYWIE